MCIFYPAMSDKDKVDEVLSKCFQYKDEREEIKKKCGLVWSMIEEKWNILNINSK